MEKWLQVAGVNVLTPLVEQQGDGKWAICIKQDAPSTEGVPAVLREQMIDIAVFKLKEAAGATTDEWDEDGELELCKKFEVAKTFERILVNGEALQKNVILLDEQPEAVLLNYRNMGYA